MCVSEALKGMEKVAEHINEMQRIHEEYGAIFDHLFRQHQKSCKQVNIYQPLGVSLAHLAGNTNLKSHFCIL
jgi:T-lymphoma invasion and metastasis-inducing protein 1